MGTLIIVSFLIGLSVLFFKLEQDANLGKNLSNIEAYFLAVMHVIGWPLLIIFIIYIYSIISVGIFIVVLLYLIGLIMAKVSSIQKIIFIVFLFVFFTTYAVYSANYAYPKCLKILQTKTFSKILHADYEKMMSIANSEFDKKNYDSAIKYYKLALKLKQDSSIAYYNIGQAKVLSSNYSYTEAIKDYTASIELNPKFIDAYFRRGLIYSVISDYNEDFQKQAIADFSKVIELEPKYIDAYLNRAIEKCKSRDFESALKDCDYILKLNSKNAEAYFTKAFIIDTSVDYKASIDRIKELDNNLRVNSKKKSHNTKELYSNEDIHIILKEKNRDSELLNSKEFKQALEKYILDTSLKSEHLDSEYELALKIYALANIYNNLNDDSRDLSTLYFKEYKQALQNYTLAIKFNQNYEEAYYNRALINETLKNSQAALDDYNKVIKINPNDVDAYFARIRLTFKMIDLSRLLDSTDTSYNVLKKIESDYRQIIKIEPNNKEAIEGLIRVNNILKDYHS